MSLLPTLEAFVPTLFPQAELHPQDRYSRLSWPKWPKLMKLETRRWHVPGFGSLMLQKTGVMGLMQLLTVSFTPNEGSQMPYLLTDLMAMGKKRVVFVEFYDCTKSGAHAPTLTALSDDYRSVPDYTEKPAWYVPMRMAGSLIKGGTVQDEQRLLAMTMDAWGRYVELWKTAPKSAENLVGLREFCDRMVRDGNPSTGTMERILGKAGAADYFRTVVMPV